MRLSSLPRPGRSIHLLVLLLSVLAGAPAGAAAADAADAHIKGALDDIEKYEGQTREPAAVTPATANRTLRLLALTRERLEGSPNKSHPSWIEADTRLTALVARLESRAKPAAGAPATPAPAPAARPAGAAQAAATPQMISQQRVRIQRLTREMASASDTLDKGGVAPFQDAGYVAKQTALVARFKETLAGFSDFPADPDVVEAGGALTKFENMIAFGQNHAAQAMAKVGDAQARLRTLDQQMPRAPQPPPWPYAGNSVQEWIVALARTRQAAAENLQQLAFIRDNAYLPGQRGTVEEGAPYDMQDVQRIDAGLRKTVSDIDQSLERFSADLDLQVADLANTLAHFDRLDPAREHDQANAFLGAGKAAELRARLAGARHLATVAVGYDRQLGREQLAAHTAMLERVENTASAFDAKHARARQLVRMPKAASTDKTLVAIARETLKTPGYETGPIRRLVVNTDKVRREKKTTETEFDKIEVGLGGSVKLTGTGTTYTYSWEQFQVATAEPVGDTFHIFYNTLKRFTSGGPTTPLDRWILAERIQSSEIPEANIDRD